MHVHLPGRGRVQTLGANVSRVRSLGCSYRMRRPDALRCGGRRLIGWAPPGTCECATGRRAAGAGAPAEEAGRRTWGFGLAQGRAAADGDSLRPAPPGRDWRQLAAAMMAAGGGKGAASLSGGGVAVVPTQDAVAAAGGPA